MQEEQKPVEQTNTESNKKLIIRCIVIIAVIIGILYIAAFAYTRAIKGRTIAYTNYEFNTTADEQSLASYYEYSSNFLADKVDCQDLKVADVIAMLDGDNLDIETKNRTRDKILFTLEHFKGIDAASLNNFESFTLTDYNTTGSDEISNQLERFYADFPDLDSSGFTDMKMSKDSFIAGHKEYSDGNYEKAADNFSAVKNYDTNYEEAKHFLISSLSNVYFYKISEVDENYLNGTLDYTNIDYNLDKAFQNTSDSLVNSIDSWGSDIPDLYDVKHEYESKLDSLLIEYTNEMSHGGASKKSEALKKQIYDSFEF